MSDAKSSPPPAGPVRVEAEILSAVCGFLHARTPALTPRQLEFLCAPWVHYFSHTLMHRLGRFAGDLSGADGPNRGIDDVPLEPPGDTLSFMELSRTDGYRAYLDATLTAEPAGFDCRTRLNALRLDLLPGSAETVGFQTCLPSTFRHLLRWSSLGKIRFLDDKPETVPLALDPSCRNALSQNIRLALAFLPPDHAAWMALRARDLFPRSLLENLPHRVQQLQPLPGHRMLFSANGWPLIDDWKIFALVQKNRHGTRLIGSPHAIGHGCLADFWQREFELAHLDTYLSWGWSGVQGRKAGQLIPFYNPYFAGQRQARPQRSRPGGGVLISSAARPRHLLEYPYTPEKFEQYLDTQLRVAEQVQKLTRVRVAIRTRPRDLGWDLQAMVAALNNPDLRLEFQQGKFLDRLAQSWLHICDNCSTTIVESLMANHPTLVLITGEYFEIAPSASQEFRHLAEAGIFHTTPASLLAQLDRIQGDVDRWWASSTTQTAIRKFLQIQGRNGSGLATWRHALLGNFPT